MAPLEEVLDALRQAVQEKAADFEPDLPDRPEPRTEINGAESEWLFDAERDYLDQLEHYKAHKTN